MNRLLSNPAAMDALMKIEGFRSLNEDIQTIINKSEAVKKAKKEGVENLTPKEKKELSDEEKEYKSKRKQIQEKLIKFATHIPVFMYLTDYRENCLKDVITQLEPGLFKKVTGLDVKDFELLVSLGVFNDSLMNDAVYKFKRYEDASLSYTGVNRHEDENRGGWDTVITNEDYNIMFSLQQESMTAPQPEIPPDKLFAAMLPEEPDDVAIPAMKPVVQSMPRMTYTPKPAAYPEQRPQPVPVPQSVPKPKEADYSGVKVGSKLAHKAFGAGTVTELDGGYITVAFGEVEKKFLFPAAFKQGFPGLEQ